MSALAFPSAGIAQSVRTTPSTHDDVISLVVDNSLSMRASYDLVKEAAGLIISEKKDSVRMTLIRFVGSSNIQAVVPETARTDQLRAGLGELKLEGGNQSITLNGQTIHGLGGQTALLDALYLSAESLVKSSGCGNSCERSLILISDGEERESYYKMKDVQKMLRMGNVRVFCIAFIDALDEKPKRNAVKFLNGLASESAGGVFYPKTSAEVRSSVNEIMTIIQK